MAAWLGKKVQSLDDRNASLLHACLVFGLLVIAVAMRAAGLDGRIDFNNYDEGVYWQSLRAMRAGYHLYLQIFYSQPPPFLLAVYPFYALLGSTIVSARAGVAVISLLGLVGAYIMGRALNGRAGGLAALAILIVTPIYLAQSQLLQAEAPAVALLFLTIAFAFLWCGSPTGRSGLALASVCAFTLLLGILTKPIDLTAIVPVSLIVVAHAWRARREASRRVRDSLLSLAGGLTVAVIAVLCILSPFAGWFDIVVQQTVMFHVAARKVAIVPPNADTLFHFFAANSVLCTAAIAGVLVAVLRRDWRIVPLGAWLLATLIFLTIHAPLFDHHTLALVPPLIAVTVLGLDGIYAVPVRKRIALRRRIAQAMGLLMVVVVLAGIRGDYRYYRDLNASAVSPGTLRTAQIAADLEQAARPGQWIVTDAQFAAALANRDTPPWLVDTSFVRVLSGYLTDRELLEAGADPRVHAVLFATGRLTAAPVAAFHDWVAGHFSLVRRYDVGVELWIR